jgi:rod shape determining protein RodA
MRKVLWRRFDWLLLGLVLVLSGFGVLMIGSALSGNLLMSWWYQRQLAFLGVGVLVLFLLAAFDYRLLATVTTPFYLAMLALLGVIAAVGTESGGAQRWLTVGELFLQPSELIKIAMILMLARYLSGHEESMGRLTVPIGALLLLAPAVTLIYLQPNLGTTLSLLVIAGTMLFVGGMRWYQIVLLGSGAAVAAVPAWQYLLKDYMRDRVLMFLNPSAAAAADRFNVEQAMISIGSGGWLGRGLFRGSQSQLHFLRVRHTDFIFSVTAEELGFVGALVMILLLAFLLLRLLRVATLARDMYGRLVVTGVTAMFFFQYVVNIGMNLNMMPVTGLPLPFISYGGSSLWSALAAIGLVQSVAMRHRKIEFE